jgi:RNA polymerase sigma-70 factor (ECF subfamily)
VRFATYLQLNLYYTLEMTAPTDRDLIICVRRGYADQADAFGEIVKRYQTSVFNVCYRILNNRNDAEDLVQETFMRAFNRLHTFDIEREFGPWIRRVAANLCLNHIESQKVEIELDDKRHADPSRRPEALTESRERSEKIRAGLASLPAKYRVVVELRHYQDMSYAEIASELNIPLSDVKSYLFRARKLLAEKLHAPD